ncbi:MAG: peptide-methionine (S)-S-oxide reductase MsrA [Patescibacteria group bacterium]
MEQNHQLATFGAGCFWGVQQMYDQIPGVINTWVGYMGGDTEDPSYEEVCSDRTGHAEVVHIEYDPQVVTYERLLELFWMNHDPTTLNRQGPDFGTQYRSVIFYHTPEQKELAQASLEELDDSGKYDDPIVTQIVPAGMFYEAEEYHQKYFDKKGIIGRCHI